MNLIFNNIYLKKQNIQSISTEKKRLINEGDGDTFCGGYVCGLMILCGLHLPWISRTNLHSIQLKQKGKTREIKKIQKNK